MYFVGRGPNCTFFSFEMVSDFWVYLLLNCNIFSFSPPPHTLLSKTEKEKHIRKREKSWFSRESNWQHRTCFNKISNTCFYSWAEWTIAKRKRSTHDTIAQTYIYKWGTVSYICKKNTSCYRLQRVMNKSPFLFPTNFPLELMYS